jgi:glycerol-3-phosphate dehydrogenase (NAD(P)+)
MAEKQYDIGIIGAGAWGTTISTLLTIAGKNVLLWAFEKEVADEVNSDHRNSVYLKGVDLPQNLTCATDFARFNKINRLIITVPSAFFSYTIQSLAPYVQKTASIVSASKGFAGPDLTRPSEILEEKFPNHQVGVLSGPNLAREIVTGHPAISLVASKNENLVRDFQATLSSERFRVYGGSDVIGTELGGALKNIMAIAGGMSDGLGLGENALAALITRGLAEMIKLGVHLRASERTFYGVSGLGDLVCTSQSILSRNHEVGRRVATGEKLEDIIKSSSSVAEGIGTTEHVHEFALRHNIDLPITSAVYGVLFENINPSRALKELMTRSLKME